MDSGEVLVNMIWRPPRSWPWPVDQRDTVSGGYGGDGRRSSESNVTSTENGSSTLNNYYNGSTRKYIMSVTV